MKRLLIAGILLFLSVSAHARQAPAPSDAEANIRGVLESFNAALATRDKPRYMSLFLNGNVSWQSVMDDVVLTREKRRNPKATRAYVDPNNTYITFIDNAVNNPKVGGAASPPAFPAKIETDGDVASVSQDYEFFYEGRVVGRGRAFWLLVRTEEGWKITAIAYSKRHVQPPRPD